MHGTDHQNETRKKEWNIFWFGPKQKKIICIWLPFLLIFLLFSGVYREQSRKITYVHEDKMMYDFLWAISMNLYMIHSSIQIHTFSRRFAGSNADIQKYVYFSIAQWLLMLLLLCSLSRHTHAVSIVLRVDTQRERKKTHNIRAMIQSKRIKWQHKNCRFLFDKYAVDMLLMS